MPTTYTYNPDGSIQRIIFDNTDKILTLELNGNITRDIPLSVNNIDYREFDALNVLTFSVSKTREQLLNLTDTYSFVYDFEYYSTGEIDTIRIRTFDASAVKIEDITIKHYLDGRQPEII